MYTTTDDFIENIKSYTRQIDCEISIVGCDDINTKDVKSIEVTQSIATSDFEIGTVNAAHFTAQISAVNNPDYLTQSYKNCNLDLKLGLYRNGEYELIPIGRYKLDTPQIEDNIIYLEGYDAIAQTDVEYIPADIYPNTLRAVAMDIAAVCELELADGSFTNEGLVIDSMPEWGEGITCRAALGYVAEIAGGCWIADRYGKLKLVTYGSVVYTIDPSMYYTVKIAKDSFPGVNTLYINSGDKELAWSVNGEVEYTIADNPILFDKQIAQDAIVELKSVMENAGYRPFEMDYICNPALDLGDGIEIVDVNGDTYTSVICSKQISYDGGLRGTLASYIDENAESRGSQSQSYSTQIKTAQKTATEAKETATEAKKTADDVKATIDNLPEINVDIINTNVVKADTMQATWCFSRYMLVQFMETNFDALDTTKSYQKQRRYIRIFDDNIKVIESELSDSDGEFYKDPDGKQLYWTAVTGENAHKFFTYTSPLTIAKDKRPDDITDADFENLYKVVVRKTLNEYIKCSLGFPTNSSGTGEPELVFGTGDTSGNGRYYFVKDSDSGRFVYTSRTDGKEYGVAIKDDAPYLVTAGELTKMYPMAVVSDVAEADNCPVGTIVLVGGV